MFRTAIPTLLALSLATGCGGDTQAPNANVSTSGPRDMLVYASGSDLESFLFPFPKVLQTRLLREIFTCLFRT